MNIKNWLIQKALNWLLPQQVAYNPKSEKFTFINDEEAIRRDELDEADAWYEGKPAGLFNVYTNKSWYGYYSNPVYNRNKQNSFWAKSASETDFKRSHCSFSTSMINVMTQKINVPKISSVYEDVNKDIQKIIASNNFNSFLTQTVVPWSLVEGTGALKPNFNKRVSPYPYLEFYKERDIVVLTVGSRIIGCAFKNYYKDDKCDDYTLYEVRHEVYDEENNTYSSAIEYHLFKMENKGSEGKEVPLETLEETSKLPADGIKVVGLDRSLSPILAFYPDSTRFGYGTSVYASKIDILDNLDEVYTVQQICTRDSVPIYIINPEYLKKDSAGNPIVPSAYDRKFMSIGDMPLSNSGAPSSSPFTVTQPKLNVEQYESEILNLKSECCEGFISPATMGLGNSKKDNADAQREKEKTTISTRNYLISVLTPIIKESIEDCLILYDYMRSEDGYVDIHKDYGVNVEFPEFSTPTFETKANILGPLLYNGAISPTSFVEQLWGEGKNKEDKKNEVEYITKELAKRKDNKNQQPITLKPNDEGGKKNLDKELSTGGDNASYRGRSTPPSTEQNFVKVK